MPFFFLLLDSFPVLFVAVESWFPLASVPAAAGVEPSAALPSVPVVVLVVTGFVEGSVPAGAGAGVAAAFGSPDAPGGLVPWCPPAVLAFRRRVPEDVPLASVPAAGGEPADEEPGLPGVTTSTTAALPAGDEPTPRVERLPGVRMSVAEVLSDSGVKFGVPVRAAATNSVCGPGRISASGFLIRVSCSRGIFCSATIHA